MHLNFLRFIHLIHFDQMHILMTYYLISTNFSQRISRVFMAQALLNSVNKFSTFAAFSRDHSRLAIVKGASTLWRRWVVWDRYAEGMDAFHHGECKEACLQDKGRIKNPATEDVDNFIFITKMHGNCSSPLVDQLHHAPQTVLLLLINSWARRRLKTLHARLVIK